MQFLDQENTAKQDILKHPSLILGKIMLPVNIFWEQESYGL